MHKDNKDRELNKNSGQERNQHSHDQHGRPQQGGQGQDQHGRPQQGSQKDHNQKNASTDD